MDTTTNDMEGSETHPYAMWELDVVQQQHHHDPQYNQHFDLGPQRDSLKIIIPVTLIYVLIFITGVIGNISTCIVIKKHRSMHTATNYYLFSLAISDFLLLLSGVPQEIYFVWYHYPYVLGEYFCIGRGFLAETSANATVLTVAAFTVERYMAICHPFLGQAMSKLSRAIRIIFIIWVFSVISAIPQAAQFGIVVINGVEKCMVVREIIQHSFQLSTYIFFFAPMSIILVLYVLIGVRLHRSNVINGDAETASTRNGGGSVDLSNGGSSRRGSRFVPRVGKNSISPIKSEPVLYRYSGGSQLTAVRGRLNQNGTRRVIKMLVAVVICFFVCWAPFHAQRLIAVYEIQEMMETGKQEFLYTVMTYLSGVLYYMSTCINPLVYNIMSNKFREAFKTMLFGKKPQGSINSRRIQDSIKHQRNATLTLSTQRESSGESLLQSK